MKDAGDNEARPNGNNAAPAPVRDHAEGKYHQASQKGDFDKVERHRPNMHPDVGLFQSGTLPQSN